jgi:hypothetical protein
MRDISRVVVALLIGAASPVVAGAAEEGQGFAELRGTASLGVSGEQLQFVERVRPTLATALGERLKLVATLEAALTEGRNLQDELRRTLDASGASTLLAQAGCTWPEPASSFFHVSGAGDYLAVDRLYLDWYGEAVDARAGRQALHWGSAQFFNPTDPFPEVLLAEPWRPRRGVNALRSHVALAELTDATLVAAVDDSLTHGRAAGRLRTHVAGTDVAVSGAWRGGASWLAGLDLRGTFGVGWWAEAALHPTGGRVHEEVAVGLDYSFPVLERLVVMAQYYRNGAGDLHPSVTSRAAGLAGAAGPTCSGASPPGIGGVADPFAPFTLARDYLLVSVVAQVTTDLSATLPVLQNVDDGSAVAIPTLSFAATDWLELWASAQVPFTTWGHGGELKPRRADLVFAAGPARVDLSGLVPTATITLWTRASF